MIPVQDVVPSGRRPVATLSLIGINTLCLLIAAGDPRAAVAELCEHATVITFVTSMWFLWLFGDNVEARAGRAALVAIYVAAGWLAAALARTLDPDAVVPGLGVAGGVTGVIGAYFVVLPRARVLMFVPTPPSLAEVPAVFFFAFWWVLQFATFVLAPAALRLDIGRGAAMWGLAAALLLGALVCWLTRRPVRWT